MQQSGDCFVVEGGQPVGGCLRPAGNKNEALPVLAASLLAPGTSQLSNVPDIRDVGTLLRIMAEMGVVTTRSPDSDEIAIDTANLGGMAPSAELGRAIRGSFLLAPGLLHRTGSAVLPRPGGDRIGRRRIDTHLHALRLLGAEVESHERQVHVSLDGRFQGTDIFFDEASVMATENAVMAATVAEGHTRIANAASEPHVQGLCRYLNAMGARISGIGTNMLEIEGVSELSPASHRIGPDHIEIGSFVAIAAMTGGGLEVIDVVPDDLRMMLMVFARLGVETHVEGTTLRVPAKQELVIQDDMDGAIPKVDDAPWPGFPTDLSSIALVLATQAAGTVLIHEKMFENRLFFVDRLITMGARVVLCDPHRAVVTGPIRLQGETITSPDIRAGMALVAAALCADGRSVIMNAHQIDRGYERIDERLRSLGARIHRT
ncbi:MAG: UDP-N-acetylglucosamine 1-carboxyvinyltransferase [bacterium]|nr:UDP-N-acetylglucosamine 1-carboxyvinyltransferase [bacterium]MCP5065773.1 UDP-N-acetylglucosamine 1-carboxyvinyltransferase [bacterium]